MAENGEKVKKPRSVSEIQADFLRAMAEARRLLAGIQEAVKRC